MKRLFKMLVFDQTGLIPAIIQEYTTKRVLTLCYMNKEAIAKTLQTGLVHVFRRSRNELMMKGQHSGCVQRIRKLFIDCEGKSLLITVDQVKAACHKGYVSCYFRNIDKKGAVKIVDKPLFDPEAVYKR